MPGKGNVAEPGSRYNIVHIGDKLVDPETNDTLGFHGHQFLLHLALFKTGQQGIKCCLIRLEGFSIFTDPDDFYRFDHVDLGNRIGHRLTVDYIAEDRVFTVQCGTA